ncbi:MAG: carboxypeptidase regulatory-like domain-containing protein [Chlorobi bacterium]|nr:carboxypeptidase regulatory-like domain-containing protein [Chlorobiota bacterium]
MKKLFSTIIFGFVFTSFLFAGEPVPGAEIIIEQEPAGDPVAYQITGSSGTATFAHLDKGVYRICVILPKLEGKLIKGSDKVKTDTKSVYNSEKRTYYIREPQGFFAVKFDGIKRIAGANIAPVYEKVKSAGEQKLFIGRFTVSEDSGEITIKVEGITPKEFQSKASKVMHDAAKTTINNVR